MSQALHPTVLSKSQQIVELQRELIIAKHTLTPNNPLIEQKTALLKAFESQVNERRTQLQQEYNAHISNEYITTDVPSSDGVLIKA